MNQADLREKLSRILVAKLDPVGCWRGELSSSALATAVAVFALHRHNAGRHARMIRHGLQWLADNINPDGGFGDTPDSPSNLSTTILCCCALMHAGPDFTDTREQAANHIRAITNDLHPDSIARAIMGVYGNDRTFSAPILACSALGGLLGSGESAWNLVPQLPFELAAMPHRLYRLLDLSVVSYAMPALISVGLLRHAMQPDGTPLRRMLRNMLTAKVLRVLEEIQPANGGFLEAAPLTAFVLMSLVAAGFDATPVCDRAAEFLVKTARPDGSWPIDTDLATWVTTLSVDALSRHGHDPILMTGHQQRRVRAWLLEQQHLARHPYTHAAPGGWAWTDLPGAVPDADDTCGALLALLKLGPIDAQVTQSGMAGLRWLLKLQNRDGGMPTFCRGWSKLVFDRSSPEITAHALRAFAEWQRVVPGRFGARLRAAQRKAVDFLLADQKRDGSWIPLWFGNQSAPGQHNPVFGTSQVLRGYAALNTDAEFAARITLSREQALRFLCRAQNRDKGWGAAAGVDSTIEETAIAVCAIRENSTPNQPEPIATRQGTEWLCEHIDMRGNPPAAPIGLYFSSLWYAQELYPLIFSIMAMD